MERQPFVRGKVGDSAEVSAEGAGPKPVVLRRHSTQLPVARVHRIEPGRLLLMPDGSDRERDAVARVWERMGGKAHRVGRFWEPDSAMKGKCACV